MESVPGMITVVYSWFTLLFGERLFYPHEAAPGGRFIVNPLIQWQPMIYVFGCNEWPCFCISIVKCHSLAEDECFLVLLA